VTANFLAVMTVAATPPRRQSADERREAVLEAAFTAFAAGGLHGVSTDEIARAAGISQPYLFRLYRTKKELFLAALAHGHARTLATMRGAAAGRSPDEIFPAMGRAYAELLAGDRRLLLMQLQGYATCDDHEVREAVRAGFGELYAYVERVSGASADEVRSFFATGMLLNVLAAMDASTLADGWAQRCLAFCAVTGEKPNL
jgi:AcrR family transcriptional regulator